MTDMYNRTVAEVINVNSSNINMEMMRVGLVILYPFQKGCGHYKPVENKAKELKLGVWSDPKFELPWDYRKRMV